MGTPEIRQLPEYKEADMGIAKALNFNEKIGLVENSGIQFLDFEFKVDWSERQDLMIKRFGTGRFIRYGQGRDYHLLRLTPDEKGDIFSNPLDPSRKFDGSDSFEKEIKIAESLKLYDGVWFPVPFYAENRRGPFNWVRCRLIRIAGDPSEKASYHATLAFDTAVSPDDGGDYQAPTVSNVNGSTIFAIGSDKDCAEFVWQGSGGQYWVCEWAENVFRDLAKLHLGRAFKDQSDRETAIEEKVHEAHYLNVLYALKEFIKPNDIRFISNKKDSIEGYTKVDLVLDVGNSRCCGILFEKSGADAGNDDFSDCRPLQLRDLNAPERVYDNAFESRVEFQQADFGYSLISSHSGRPDAFVWPSFGRVGSEAATLASNRTGSEGCTGLNSPKRYLWQNEPRRDAPQWSFNTYSYQIPYPDPDDENIVRYFRKTHGSKPVQGKPITNLITSSGQALFAAGEYVNMTAKFSLRSIMTFMLLEVFAQTISQINSFESRNNGKNKQLPRRLDSIVLTTPPAMPDIERESLRGCAYEALGILWKCLGYDKSPADEFKFITEKEKFHPQIPRVMMNWDEAQAGQIVYLYNETQKVYRGNCRTFIEELRRKGTEGRFKEPRTRKDNGKEVELISARIASVDIGGGTTDLVITDYTFPKNSANQSDDIIPYELLREGFKMAGDDILYDIVKQQILAPLTDWLEKNKDPGCNRSVVTTVYDLFKLSNDSHIVTARQQCVQQILSKVGYRIISYLENVAKLPRGVTEASCHGTIREFIEGLPKENFSSPQLCPISQDRYRQPDDLVLNYFNGEAADEAGHEAYGLRALKSDFDILDFELDIDLFELNRNFSLGVATRIATPLDHLASIIEVYDCDVLLVTGRPSKIPGIRDHFLQKLSLPPKRQIFMHSYSCGSWYPMAHDGDRIGDPKTTVAVGALLALKRTSSGNMPNFHFRPDFERMPSPERFFGSLDAKDLLDYESVRYRLRTIAESYALKNAGKPYAGEDPNEMEIDPISKEQKDIRKSGFITELTHKLGYRQFDNKYYPATLTYVIETYKNLEDLKEVRDASSLNLPDDLGIEELINRFKDNDAIDILKHAFDDYQQSLAALENGTAMAQYEADLEAELSDKVAAQVESEFAGRRSGLFGRKKLEEEKAARRQQLTDEMRQAYVRDVLSSHGDEMKRQVEQTFRKAAHKAVVKNLNTVKEKNQKLLDDVNAYADKRGRFNLMLDLSFSYPKEYEYLREELKHSAYPPDKVNTFVLTEADGIDEVREGTRKISGNFKNVVRMKLKTAAYDDYWLDSGVIQA